ncbi:siroheme synthase [Thalassospira sp.]|uniref:siroheme synthase n=1 Tax=Thalassospira sp. TaxID=1912094 RepID=UPI000C4456C7|nr:siroheme synthase [Thalassospira sp.]MAL40528.1 siroheme synthase [Thalassospira sp.]
MTHYRAPQNNRGLTPYVAAHAETSENFAYFPAFIHVTGKKVLVLGGGEVALGKLRLLVRSQAKITVVAPEICDDIAVMVDEGRIVWESAPFVDTMINRAVMVFDAADDPYLTARVQAATRRRNILLNVVDKTPHCDFIVPAILDRAPVMITISTGACAPALARIIRQRLETVLPASMAQLARIARDARQKVADHLHDNVSRQRFWTHFFQRGLQETPTDTPRDSDIDHALRQFVPDGSSATVPGGQIMNAEIHADTAFDLPHGIARAIETADIVFHEDHIAEDILTLARRDATLIPIGCISLDHDPDTKRDSIEQQTRIFARQGFNIVTLTQAITH